jgi:magnesium chelatase subunit D
MKYPVYPFSAIVGQEEMKLALLLAAVDWRISVLLRGDKGAGKTTTARGLATLLPSPGPFVNLPIGATEDRLLGGLNIERALKGDPVLKPGLLSEAHGGVLYVDEVNLLPAHLGDMLLDTASSGVNVIEREGLSASHAAEFVLLGSMNPEEGLLRPQLLDRFALAVDISAPSDPLQRQSVVERRIAFERDAASFDSEWAQTEQRIRDQIASARVRLTDINCSKQIFAQISAAISEMGVCTLRADLAAVRASIAYAALSGDASVNSDHVTRILPLVLAHRVSQSGRPLARRPKPPEREPSPASESSTPEKDPPPVRGDGLERIFSPKESKAFPIQTDIKGNGPRGSSAKTPAQQPGPVIGARKTDTPAELDLRASLHHAVTQTGSASLRLADLHERVRKPMTGIRYLFVVDSSGSHAAQERMRLVKGAASGLLADSFKNGDEIAIIVFRGPSAQVVLEPTQSLHDAITVLEYLPTGGRTPLAHALDLARSYVTETTVLVLLTDGRANVALATGDPWQEAVDIASQIKARALVIDTENSTERLGHPRDLARALGAEYVSLDNLELNDDIALALQRLPYGAQES